MLLALCTLLWLLPTFAESALVPPKRPEAYLLRGARRVSSLIFLDGAEAHVSTSASSDEQLSSFSAALLRHLHRLGVAAPQGGATLVVKIMTSLSGDEQVPEPEPHKRPPRLYIVIVPSFDTPGVEDLYARRLLSEALRVNYFRPRLIKVGIDGLRILAFNPYQGENFTGSLVGLTGRDVSEYEPARNMNGYPIKASVWPFPPKAIIDDRGKMWGVDIRIYESLVSFLNASRSLNVYTDVTQASRAYDLLHLDYIVNCRFFRVEKEMDSDFLYPYEKCSYCIIVPKAPPVALYKHLFFPFSAAVWWLLLPTTVLSAILWCAIGKMRHWLFDSTAVNTADTLLLTIRIILTGSSGSLPSWLADRVALLALALFSLVVANSFQGSLTSYLTVPRSQPDIDSLHELAESPLGVYVHPNTTSLLVSSDQDDVFDRLSNKMVFHNSLRDVAERILEAGNMSGAVDEVTGRMLVRQRAHWRGGRPRLHLVPECLSPNYVAPTLRRGAPFFSVANAALQRLVEAGLTARWAQEAADLLDATGVTIPQHRHHHQLQPAVAITATHLALAFAVLASGLCLAATAFAAELLVFRNSQPQTLTVSPCASNCDIISPADNIQQSL